MDLFLKAALGAAVVLILAALAKTKNYYIAGLVPLFPTFALIAHYIVGKGRSVEDLKTTILFGMWSIIPYFVYLATLYVVVDRLRLEASLAVAAVVLILAALAKTRNYYIAGLVPLFPTFALIAHYIVGKGRSVDDLKTTILFGMWSIIPYFVYLATLYVLVDRLRLEASLAVAALAWLMAATVLVSVWVRLQT